VGVIAVEHVTFVIFWVAVGQRKLIRHQGLGLALGLRCFFPFPVGVAANFSCSDYRHLARPGMCTQVLGDWWCKVFQLFFAAITKWRKEMTNSALFWLRWFIYRPSSNFVYVDLPV